MIATFLKYLEYEKRYSRHTLISYESDLQQFTVFLSSHYPELNLTTVDHRIMRSWIVSLVEQEMENSSINRKVASLRSFYRFLLKREKIEQDPTQKLKALKKSKKLPQFVNEADMVGLLDDHSSIDFSESQLDKMIMELLYGTGIRLSELIHLKVKDVNLNQSTIKVLGKRNKERIIPFSISLKTSISDYLKTHQPSDYFLTTEEGKPLYPMFVYRVVKKYLTHINVDKRSPHVLRHTYATHLLNKGAELNAVKELLGHTSLAATQVYTHNSIDKLKSVFKKAHPKA